MVEDWFMVLHIGIGKASDCRMSLEGVCAMNLDTQAPAGIAGIPNVLVRMKCTYVAADTEKEQSTVHVAGTCVVTQRSRPDTIIMAKRLNSIIQKQGLDFQSVIDGQISKYNADKVEGFGIV